MYVGTQLSYPLIYDINLESIEVSNLFNQNAIKIIQKHSNFSITFKSLAFIPCLTDYLFSLTTLLFANLFINLSI